MTLRSLSRSVKYVRESLAKAGVAKPLISLLEDPSLEVRMCAGDTICNVVLDASVMRATVVQEGGIPILVRLSRSPHAAVQYNAVVALQNLVLKADSNTKVKVPSDLTLVSFGHVKSTPVCLVCTVFAYASDKL